MTASSIVEFESKIHGNDSLIRLWDGFKCLLNDGNVISKGHGYRLYSHALKASQANDSLILLL